MLVGFSVGGFCVLSFLLVLCFKRLDYTGKDDVEKTLVEIDRLRNTSVSIKRLRSMNTNRTMDYPISYSQSNRYHTPHMQDDLSGFPAHIIYESPKYHLQVDGTVRSVRSPQQVSIKRRSSHNRSITPSHSARGTPGETEGRVLHYYDTNGNLAPIRIASEMSVVKTADEAIVERRSTNKIKRRQSSKKRRSSLSHKDIEKVRRKLKRREERRRMKEERRKKMNDSSESSSPESKVSPKIASGQDVLQDLWVKGESRAHLQDVWSDDEGQFPETRMRSASTGATKPKNEDSIIVIGIPNGEQDSPEGADESDVDLAELRTWREQLGRDTRSIKTNKSRDDDHSSQRARIHRATPSITRTWTGNIKEVSLLTG